MFQRHEGRRIGLNVTLYPMKPEQHFARCYCKHCDEAWRQAIGCPLSKSERNGSKAHGGLIQGMFPLEAVWQRPPSTGIQFY